MGPMGIVYFFAIYVVVPRLAPDLRHRLDSTRTVIPKTKKEIAG